MQADSLLLSSAYHSWRSLGAVSFFFPRPGRNEKGRHSLAVSIQLLACFSPLDQVESRLREQRGVCRVPHWVFCPFEACEACNVEDSVKRVTGILETRRVHLSKNRFQSRSTKLEVVRAWEG